VTGDADVPEFKLQLDTDEVTQMLTSTDFAPDLSGTAVFPLFLSIYLLISMSTFAQFTTCFVMLTYAAIHVLIC